MVLPHLRNGLRASGNIYRRHFPSASGFLPLRKGWGFSWAGVALARQRDIASRWKHGPHELRNGFRASGNTYRRRITSASGFSMLRKGRGHFLGRGLLWRVNEILRAGGNMALHELGNGLRAPGNTYRSHSPSASGFLPLRKGWGHFLGRGLPWVVNEILRADGNMALMR